MRSIRPAPGKGAPCLLVALLACAACSSGPSAPDEGSYVERIAGERDRKERMFRESSDSPIPPGRHDELLPLSYFAVDLSYSAPAVLKLAEDRPVFEMPTSTGKMRRMERVGVLEFTLGGEARSLGAFVEAGTRRITRLFVPFSDATTGTETYFAGRYLDLDPTSTGMYEIDFNRAYNPYCAYNEAYDCPFPPPSNRLKVPVRAGERMRAPAPRTESSR
ncbi:MAG: DUF1684 domain-containing protein [Vicinamibacterales bacterium]